MTGNIVEHGFPNCKAAEPLIDLRVVVTDGDLVIRIHDNCPKFDVTGLFMQANAEDADLTKNIGVRIVSRIASDIQYFRVFDMNSLILRFHSTAVHSKENAAD